jgi:hypothetical protein
MAASPQTVRKKSARDQEAPIASVDGESVFVQVRAAFQPESTLTEDGRNHADDFLYYC